MQVSATATQALFARIAAEQPAADDWQLVLGIFFKVTCPTCAMSWHYFDKLYRTYGSAGLAVWGLSQDPRDQALHFASKNGGSFPILVDDDWQLSRAFDPQFVPAALLLGRDGQMIESIIGFDKAKLNRMSELVAGRLQVSKAVIAPPYDGNPAFRPG